MATYSITNNIMYKDGVAILQAVDNNESFVLKDLCDHLNGLSFQGQKLIINTKSKTIWSNGKIIIFILNNINNILPQIKHYSENNNSYICNEVLLRSKKKEVLRLDTGKNVILKR